LVLAQPVKIAATTSEGNQRQAARIYRVPVDLTECITMPRI
jgi:hypothetical protein